MFAIKIGESKIEACKAQKPRFFAGFVFLCQTIFLSAGMDFYRNRQRTRG
jgi:hypothetical protein